MQVSRPQPEAAETRILVGIFAYQGLLLATAAALLTAAWSYGVGNLYAVVGLACVAALAERSRVKLGGITEVSISVLPTVFAAGVFGPLAGMLVAIGSFLGDFPIDQLVAKESEGPNGAPYLKWGVYTCVRSIYGAVAGFAAVAVGTVFASGITHIVLMTVTAALVAEPLDVFFGTLTLKLRGGSPWPFVRMFVPMVVVSVALYTPVVALLAVSYARVSPWTLALFFLPGLAAQRLFGLYQEQRQLTSRLVDANVELERANLSFATALVTTLDARDRYTAGHSAAVAIYARDIAKRMSLAERDARVAYVAGLVHDIGKIGLSAGVLEKPGALTLDERRDMQRHSEIGERILAKVDTYAEIATIVRHHHERVDGEGYPDRLTDDQIPLISRIIGVADAYNAMTSDRPYRDAMPSRVARLRLAQAVESQFDTSVVAAFEAILAGASEAYRMAQTPEFTFEWQTEELDEPAVRPLAAVVSL